MTTQPAAITGAYDAKRDTAGLGPGVGSMPSTRVPAISVGAEGRETETITWVMEV